MDTSQVSQLMFSISMDRTTINTVLDPNVLSQFWASLAIQVVPGNDLIGIPGPTFRILDEGAKHFIAHRFASAVGESMVKFVFDGSGTHPDRYFLGRASFFQVENIVANTGGLDIWVPPGYPIQHPNLPAGASPRDQAISTSNRRRARGGTIKVPRPPNAYILYRRDRHKAVKKANPKISNNEICRQWNDESDDIRAHYHLMAVEIKRQVEALHPHYKYNPRKSSEIRRRARGNNEVHTIQSPATAEILSGTEN